ncbi:hypothetical protein FRAAL0260 [Frankia alni ACN14a]|uniref:Uncharacterized protein n=1 Tax=Frankia alni (strain DSM 45986 / CECT 9034 / ACN14a) TaxID=326424 RepID=Q0RAN1_FRAAA|nr:hypothetical protein FRAAL0260 [Frankia alni ACN14a]
MTEFVADRKQAVVISVAAVCRSASSDRQGLPGLARQRLIAGVGRWQRLGLAHAPGHPEGR